MDIMALMGDGGFDINDLKKMMRKGKKTEDPLSEILNQDALVSPANKMDDTINGNIPKDTPQNMAKATPRDKFKDTSYTQQEEKNYTKATLAGMKAVSSQQNRQDAILNVAMNQMGNSDSYVSKVLAGKKAAHAMMQEMQRSVQEASERNLKDNRENIESIAEQAITGSTSTPDIATQKVATANVEVSISSAVNDAVVPTAPTAGSAPAPTTPSVDMIV